MLVLRPGLETLWQNLGFLSLLLMGLLLSVLQNRGLSPTRAIFVTVLILNGLALLLLVGQAWYQGITLQALLAQRGAEIMQTVHQVLGEGGSAAPLIPGVPQAEAEAILQRLLPGLLVTNTGLVAWLNVVLLRQLAVVATGRKPEPPLYYFALPEWLIFGALGAGFMMFLPVAPLAGHQPEPAAGPGGAVFLPGSRGGVGLVQPAGAASDFAGYRLPPDVFEPAVFLDYHPGSAGPVARFSPPAPATRGRRRRNRKLKVILTKDITALGSLGAVVDVARGYARNYLVPQGLAMEATQGNLARVEKLKAKYAQVRAKEQETALAKVAALEGVSVSISQRVGEGERLYGSVTAAMIVEALAAKGFDLDRKQLDLEEPIKKLGTYEVAVRLAPEVKATITVEVLAEAE